MAATPLKPGGNPDIELSNDELVKKLDTTLGTLGTALEPLGLIARDAEGKAIKPPKDSAGLIRLTMQAWRGQYKKQMKEYGGASDIADDLNNMSAALNRKLNECALQAKVMQELVRDADANLDSLAETFAKNNAPKITKLIAKEDERIRKAQDRREKLSKFATGKGSKKTANA